MTPRSRNVVRDAMLDVAGRRLHQSQREGLEHLPQHLSATGARGRPGRVITELWFSFRMGSASGSDAIELLPLPRHRALRHDLAQPHRRSARAAL